MRWKGRVEDQVEVAGEAKKQLKNRQLQLKSIHTFIHITIKTLHTNHNPHIQFRHLDLSPKNEGSVLLFIPPELSGSCWRTFEGEDVGA